MRPATKWAWALWVAFVLALGAATYAGMSPARGEPISVVDAIWAASFIGFPTAGAIVVSRMPRRPLGWMLLGAPLVLEVGLLVDELASHFLDDQPLVAAWLIWSGAVFFDVSLAVLVAIPLFLPNGELPSARWRWVARSIWVFAGVMGAHAALQSGPFLARRRPVQNPLGIEALEPVLSVFGVLLDLMTLVVVAAGVVSLFMRFRSARGPERQQLKWLALGGAAMLTSIGASLVILATGIRVNQIAMTLLFVFAILCLPTSIAIAVMKTRLYDIDLVINKTLVYALLSAVLALSYLGIIVVLQGLFGSVVQSSDLVVAASTLAVAALFRPLRTRVQSFIDRRFYRRKYDAAETLGAFSTRLRDQVDLETLRGDIVEVVHETMQPRHASLWLRSEVTE